MIFFTSDLHFSSKRTLDFSFRGFKDIKEMDLTIIKNWNNVVNTEDIVYILGDFGNYEKSPLLKGKKYLLYGNYEYRDISKEFGNNLYNFESFLKEKDLITLKKNFFSYSGHKFHLIHEPANFNPNMFNLFGHIHKLQMVKKFGLNVGIDCHNFEPISIETILFYKNVIEKYYDKNVFIQE